MLVPDFWGFLDSLKRQQVQIDMAQENCINQGVAHEGQWCKEIHGECSEKKNKHFKP